MRSILAAPGLQQTGKMYATRLQAAERGNPSFLCILEVFHFTVKFRKRHRPSPEVRHGLKHFQLLVVAR
jgi:hypothetical protein